MTIDRIISIDAETNGLSGRAFAVALTLSDRHRRDGACLDPAGLRMHRDERGVWRWDSVGDGPSARNRSPQTADTPMVGASGRLGPVEAKSGPCCVDHNRHCEPPSELCCHSCPEIAHDMFPIRHGDGSPCVLDRPAHPIADGGIGASIVILDAREDA